jgi:outer membrane receptor protein involved in Fe transport
MPSILAALIATISVLATSAHSVDLSTGAELSAGVGNSVSMDESTRADLPTLTEVSADGVVSGIVRSANGEPIPFAAVSVVGMDLGTIADADASYTLRGLRSGRYTLVASAMGFRPDTTTIVIPSHGADFLLQVEPLRLPTLTVSGERPDEAERTTAFVGTIRLAEAITPGLSVPELLDDVVGIQIREMGGYGSFSTVSLRGSSAEQVRIYLDGVPLNQALGGGVNLSTIPITTLDRVDVYRGVIPPQYGGSGTAGVINFRTRAPSDTLQWRLRSSYGSWGTRMFSGWATRSIGVAAALIALDHSASENNFRYFDDNGTSYNKSDDTWARRRNNEFESTQIMARISASPGSRLRWSTSYSFLTSIDHLPGNSTFHASETQANLQTEQHLAQINTVSMLPANSTATVDAHYSKRRDQFDDRLGQVGLGRQATDDATHAAGARTTLQTNAFPDHLLALHTNAEWEEFVPDERLITDTDMRASVLVPSGRTQVAGYLSDEYTALNQTLTLTGQFGLHNVTSRVLHNSAAVGYDVSRDTTNAVYTPHSIGISWQVRPGVTIRSNWGRYARVPNLYELFGDRGGTIGNDTLHAEIGTNRDIGVSLDGSIPIFGVSHGTLELVYFDSRVTDAIVFWEVYNRVRPFNMGATRVHGIEFSGGAEIIGGLSLSGNVMWQRPKNLATATGSLYYGNDLPNQPRWQADLRPEYRWRNVAGFYHLQAHGRYYAHPSNALGDKVSAAVVHDAGITYNITRHVSISVEARNLSDVREFHSRYVPLPGRSWFFTMQGSSM